MQSFTIPQSARDPLRLEPRCMIAYGYPGVGKTPISLTLPKCGMIDTHQGSHQYSGLILDVCEQAQKSGDRKWRIYLEACRQFRESGIQFLIVDHVGHLADWADEMALDLFCEGPIGKSWKNDDGSKGFAGQSILDLPGPKGSAGWGRLWEAFMKLVEAAHLGAPYKTVFIGHPMERIAFADAKDTTNLKQDDLARAEELDLGGPKMKKMFCSSMDAIGFMKRNWEGNRTDISFKAKDAFTRTRCPHLDGAKLWFSNPATLAEWARIYPNTLAEHLLPEDRKALEPLLAKYGGASTTAQPPLASH